MQESVNNGALVPPYSAILQLYGGAHCIMVAENPDMTSLYHGIDCRPSTNKQPKYLTIG
jgi:hypothetical protein